MVATLLLITGVITAAPVLQFLAPKPALKALYQLELSEPGGLFFARHWGIVCGSIGALIIWAASHPELRAPILAAVLVEKICLVLMIAAAWSKPHTRGMRLVMVFDALCSCFYGAILLGLV